MKGRSLAKKTQPRKQFNRLAETDSVAVIGLGRFGSSLALELMNAGAEVLGIDSSETVVQNFEGHLTKLVKADSLSETALRQLAIPEFSYVVIAIGSDIEASILTASLLLRFNIENIWAKATSDAHGQILQQLGVHHVIYPERDMGRRVAHLVRGRMQDYFEIGYEQALIITSANSAVIGKAQPDPKHNVEIVARCNPQVGWSSVREDTIIEDGDTLLIIGPSTETEAFGRIR